MQIRFLQKPDTLLRHLRLEVDTQNNRLGDGVHPGGVSVPFGPLSCHEVALSLQCFSARVLEFGASEK